MYFVTIIIILSDMQIIRYSFKSICYRFVIPARHAIACKLFCWALHAQAKAHWRGRWWAAHWRRYACDYAEWVWVYLCDREGQYPAFPARMWCAYMLRQEHIRRCAYMSRRYAFATLYVHKRGCIIIHIALATGQCSAGCVASIS